MNKKKIDTTKYKSRFDNLFGTNAVTFNKIEYIVEKLSKVKEEAFEYFKNRDFYDAACLYKSLLDHILEYLSHVEDEFGKLSDVVYELIRYYSQSCKNSDIINKQDFFKESIELYIKEDLGFMDELSKMIVDNIENNEEIKHVVKHINNEITKENISKYNSNKLIELLLKIYRKYNMYKDYLEACKNLSEDRWEKYVKPSEIYEALGEYEKAIKIIEEGKNKLPKYKDILEKRYNELKKRILGF